MAIGSPPAKPMSSGFAAEHRRCDEAKNTKSLATHADCAVSQHSEAAAVRGHLWTQSDFDREIGDQFIARQSGPSISLSRRYHDSRLRRIRFATCLDSPGADEDEPSQAPRGSAWIDFLAYATPSVTFIGLSRVMVSDSHLSELSLEFSQPQVGVFVSPDHVRADEPRIGNRLGGLQSGLIIAFDERALYLAISFDQRGKTPCPDSPIPARLRPARRGTASSRQWPQETA